MGWIGAGGGAAVEVESEWIEGRWREDIAAMMWRHAPFNFNSLIHLDHGSPSSPSPLPIIHHPASLMVMVVKSMLNDDETKGAHPMRLSRKKWSVTMTR
jgi:hypothetical protein